MAMLTSLAFTLIGAAAAVGVDRQFQGYTRSVGSTGLTLRPGLAAGLLMLSGGALAYALNAEEVGDALTASAGGTFTVEGLKLVADGAPDLLGEGPTTGTLPPVTTPTQFQGGRYIPQSDAEVASTLARLRALSDQFG